LCNLRAANEGRQAAESLKMDPERRDMSLEALPGTRKVVLQAAQ